MNDTNALWRQHKELQRLRRNKRRPERMDKLLTLRKEGFSIELKSEYCVRINGRLDIWLTHNRYHDIRENKRGGFVEVQTFVRRFFQRDGDAQLKEVKQK